MPLSFLRVVVICSAGVMSGMTFLSAAPCATACTAQAASFFISPFYLLPIRGMMIV
jgi:hypothetical protein